MCPAKDMFLWQGRDIRKTRSPERRAWNNGGFMEQIFEIVSTIGELFIEDVFFCYLIVLVIGIGAWLYFVCRGWDFWN
jgi:hypothetical protein